MHKMSTTDSLTKFCMDIRRLMDLLGSPFPYVPYSFSRGPPSQGIGDKALYHVFFFYAYCVVAGSQDK